MLALKSNIYKFFKSKLYITLLLLANYLNLPNRRVNHYSICDNKVIVKGTGAASQNCVIQSNLLSKDTEPAQRLPRCHGAQLALRAKYDVQKMVILNGATQ